MRLLGVVLAGGESRRFGSDKARALLGGMALADHARATLAPFVAEVALSGAGGIADCPAPGHRRGSVGGSRAGFAHAAAGPGAVDGGVAP